VLKFEKIKAPIDVVVFNCVKFVRRKIGEIMHYLPDKKISAASQTVATARIAPKICQSQAAPAVAVLRWGGG